MAITGIAERVRTSLAHLHGSGADVATKAELHEIGTELLQLAEAVERLSAEVDRLADGRWGVGPARS